LRRILPLLAILTLALTLRAVFLYLYVTTHSARALATIPFLFEPGNIAASIAAGHGFSNPFRVETGPTAWMTPVYPYFLAGVFRIFGTYTLEAFLAAAGFNALCSALTTIPLWFAAKRIGGAPTAILATLLWAVFPTALILPYESLWDSSLSGLLATTLLWATLTVADSTRTRHWVGYGLLWGLALMTNAALIALLPFLFGWAEYQAHRKQTYRFHRPALAATMALLCCVPWTIRNYREFHAFVPLRSVAGLALWLGNNERAQSNSVAGLHPISNQAERDRYTELGEIAYMREKQSLALDYLLTHPAAEFSLISQRFTAFWSAGSTNLFRDFPRAGSARFYLVILSNLLAGLGAFAAVVMLWRTRSPFAVPLSAFPVVFPLVYYLALAPPRYRHPIDPVLLLLAALAFTSLANYKESALPAKLPVHREQHIYPHASPPARHRV
jgi:4-amino-4-deoxy-L-arabinose transferase-like glycosyltransferase